MEASELFDHVDGDIRDLDLLRTSLRGFQPDMVFHLAAQAIVKSSYEDPVSTYSTNLMGTVNLLEAVRDCQGVEAVVFVTSDKCYSNKEWVWGYRETDELGGHDPYSASKAAAELIVESYRNSFFCEKGSAGIATVRAGNVIGGGDWAKDRIIPDFIRSVESETQLELRSPGATRPWQHVLEPLSGYVLLGSQLSRNPDVYSGAWNFGPAAAKAHSVGAVVTRMSELFATEASYNLDNRKHEHEAGLLQLNCDKANQLLNWHPRWDIEQTLQATADWYRSFLQGQDVREITNKQIFEYFPELVIA